MRAAEVAKKARKIGELYVKAKSGTSRGRVFGDVFLVCVCVCVCVRFVLVVLAVAFSWEANALSRGAQDADLAEERSQDTSNYNDGCSDCK